MAWVRVWFRVRARGIKGRGVKSRTPSEKSSESLASSGS